MAKHVNMWEDANGRLYYREADADFADAKARLLKAAEGATKSRADLLALGRFFDTLLEPGELRPLLQAYLVAIEALPLGGEGFPLEGHAIHHTATTRPVVPLRTRAIRTGEEIEAAPPAERELEEAWGEVSTNEEADQEYQKPETVRTQGRRSNADAQQSRRTPF
jgi:hypothetical protein